MSVYDLMKQRCSVRSFEERPIEQDVLVQVLDAGRIAPSACNFQPWHFVIIEDTAMQNRLSERWGGKAPILIVVCGDHSQSWKRGDGKDHCDIDVAITVDHMTLMAAELGLGTCWVCAFDAAHAASILALPDHIEPVALLPIGYPTKPGDPNRHDELRKPLDDIVSWGAY